MSAGNSVQRCSWQNDRELVALGPAQNMQEPAPPPAPAVEGAVSWRMSPKALPISRPCEGGGRHCCKQSRWYIYIWWWYYNHLQSVPRCALRKPQRHPRNQYRKGQRCRSRRSCFVIFFLWDPIIQSPEKQGETSEVSHKIRFQGESQLRHCNVKWIRSGEGRLDSPAKDSIRTILYWLARILDVLSWITGLWSSNFLLYNNALYILGCTILAFQKAITLQRIRVNKYLTRLFSFEADGVPLPKQPFGLEAQ